MGYTTYSCSDRSIRATADGYYHKSLADISTQTALQRIHEQMNPNGVEFRECNDSEKHPTSLPIQLYLDVTGSMLTIPQELIRDGLPKLMSSLIQRGIDAALMFGAIGDHECDSAPLQIGQFESGDAELDMWLTRTWLEAGGGSNYGESYLLAWYFAANHIKTDCWGKRKQRGIVITVGDEPTLKVIPRNALKEIMGDALKPSCPDTAAELLAAAQETNDVYHVFVEHGYRKCDAYWKELLGQNLRVAKNAKEVIDVIIDIIVTNYSANACTIKTTNSETSETSDSETPIML